MEYDLGKWHHELGDYDIWEKCKLEDFEKRYEVKKLDRINLTTGGVLLLAEATDKWDKIR